MTDLRYDKNQKPYRFGRVGLNHVLAVAPSARVSEWFSSDTGEVAGETESGNPIMVDADEWPLIERAVAKQLAAPER